VRGMGGSSFDEKKPLTYLTNLVVMIQTDKPRYEASQEGKTVFEYMTRSALYLFSELVS